MNNIKVTVDFVNGCYNIAGIYNGGIYSIHKPIVGREKDGNYINNYSSKIINEGRRELESVVKRLMEENPEFKASRETIKDVDYLMYKTLKEWDELNEDKTSYAIDYLKTVVQEFDMDEKPGLSIDTFEEECKKIRTKNLKNSGIEISYKVGLINANSDMSILDRIRGIKIAKRQQELMDVEVINSFIIKKFYYLNDKDLTDSDILDNMEEKIVEETIRQYKLRDNADFFKESQRKLDEQEELDEDYWLDDEDEEYWLDDGDDEGKNDVLDRISDKLRRNKLKEETDEINAMSQKAKNVLEKMSQEIEQLKKDAKEELLKDKIQEVDIRIKKAELEEQKQLANSAETTEKEESAEQDNKDSEEESKIQEEDKSENNKAFSEKNENQKNSKKRFWTRIIKSPKDSIKNKKYMPLKDRIKKRIIKGAITLITAGSVALTIYSMTKIGNNITGKIDNPTEYETEYTLPNDETEFEQTESEIETETETINETEAETEAEIETETEKETKSKTKNATEIETETKSEIETEAEMKSETEAETEAEIETETETETVAPKVSEKTDEEKMEEFRQIAIGMYMDAFIIGEKPVVGDMLDNKIYYEMPDGSGKVGHFSNYNTYKVEHIEIIGNDKWEPIYDEGKSLTEILEKYPNRTGYSLHFSNSETNGGLGFITEPQLEEMINQKVNEIIETNKTDIIKKLDEEQDNER